VVDSAAGAVYILHILVICGGRGNISIYSIALRRDGFDGISSHFGLSLPLSLSLSLSLSLLSMASVHWLVVLDTI